MENLTNVLGQPLTEKYEVPPVDFLRLSTSVLANVSEGCRIKSGWQLVVLVRGWRYVRASNSDARPHVSD